MLIHAEIQDVGEEYQLFVGSDPRGLNAGFRVRRCENWGQVLLKLTEERDRQKELKTKNENTKNAAPLKSDGN